MKKRTIPKTQAGIEKKIKELGPIENIKSVEDAIYFCRLQLLSLDMDIKNAPDKEPFITLKQKMSELRDRWQTRLDRLECNLQFDD